MRSTFAAELLAATAAADAALVWALALEELRFGAMSPARAKRRRERGGRREHVILTIDAMSIFAAIVAARPKVPAERSLMGHLFWLAELVRLRALSVSWCDTRDMVADALTKGTVDRRAILAAMRGQLMMVHEAKTFSKREQDDAPQEGSTDDDAPRD